MVSVCSKKLLRIMRYFRLKSLEAFAKAADGQATKIIIPSDIQGIAGLSKSIVEIAKENG